MSLTSGTRLGPYEIQIAIGAGGMGEVYKARDTKLNRDVALKVLPASVADDPERLARFRREAQALAAMNHPNIAQIYGFEDSGATHALVMELVPGQTLQEIIQASGLGPNAPIQQSLTLARQIADALDAAHEQGIIHRDLKPANIKVTDDGTVKVLDFGLAKALGPDGSDASADAMMSPTLTARSTQLGMILGTAAYMAPEQAKGKTVDRRADIWAFGCVLYEMLTGRRTFEGEDVSDVLASVLRQDVDWSALPKDTPPNVRRLLERCLERDPKRRLRSIGDAWIEMDAPAAAPAAPALDTRKPSAVARWLPWIAAGLIAGASVAWAVLRTPAVPSRVVTRSAVPQKDLSLFVNVSRDGTRLVYTVAGGPRSALLALRSMDQFEGKPIPGADGGAYPLFSPDGQWVAYSTLDQPAKIKKIPITGGTSITVGDGNLQNGAAWSDDDTIVFCGPKGLMRVAAAGGTPEALTKVDAAKNEIAHVRPQFLPGGRQLLFTVITSGADSPQFAVLDLAKGGYARVTRGGNNGRYATSGHLTYVRGATLFALPFDLARLAVAGAEVPVIEGVSTIGPDGIGDYSLSEAGLLVYVASDAAAQGTTLAWVDRKGSTEILHGPAQQKWGTGRVSPDGLRVANGIQNDKGGTDIWVLDPQRGTTTRLTFAGNNDNPIWTSDGRRVIYAGEDGGKSGLYEVPADSSGKPVLILATERPALPSSLTPDGQTLLFSQVGADNRRQVFVLPLGGSAESRKPRPLHDAAGAENSAAVSPDGRWVAYDSNESGTREVYVQPFPGPGPRTRISTQGGLTPRWGRGGRELFYWANQPTSRFTVVDMPPSSPGAGELRPGAPHELFQLLSGTTWDVTPDHDRFLVELTAATGGSTIATVTDWFEELRRRAPAKK